jgi:hypothetical protein
MLRLSMSVFEIEDRNLIILCLRRGLCVVIIALLTMQFVAEPKACALKKQQLLDILIN